MVETAGIEPACKESSTCESTCVVGSGLSCPPPAENCGATGTSADPCRPTFRVVARGFRQLGVVRSRHALATLPAGERRSARPRGARLAIPPPERETPGPRLADRFDRQLSWLSLLRPRRDGTHAGLWPPCRIQFVPMSRVSLSRRLDLDRNRSGRSRASRSRDRRILILYVVAVSRDDRRG